MQILNCTVNGGGDIFRDHYAFWTITQQDHYNVNNILGNYS